MGTQKVFIFVLTYMQSIEMLILHAGTYLVWHVQAENDQFCIQFDPKTLSAWKV